MLLEQVAAQPSPVSSSNGTEPIAPAEQSVRGNAAARDHLRFLDGIRGMAALYVVAGHAVFCSSDNFSRAVLKGISYPALKWLAYGQFAVAIFIVLSGYCLMLPVSKSADRTLRGGAKAYFLRRARRILPPYYAALILTLLLLWSQPALPSNQLLSTGAVVSHFVMLHLLQPEWNHAINSPMWSVATEWWIYFALPWLLLPMWKRVGSVGMIVAAAVVAAIPALWVRDNFEWARPWYLVLFAMGAAAADLEHGKTRGRSALIITKAGLAVAALATVALAFCFGCKSRLGNWYFPVIDTVQGTIAVGFIMWIASDKNKAVLPRAQNAAKYFFESRPIHFLGTISYSLYLIHYPMLELFNDFGVRIGLFGLSRVAVVGVVGTGGAIFFSYLFYLPFERPFCRQVKASRRAAE